MQSDIKLFTVIQGAFLQMIANIPDSEVLRKSDDEEWKLVAEILFIHQPNRN